jgi:hypothetical protein
MTTGLSPEARSYSSILPSDTDKQSAIRVVGSNYTAFSWGGYTIAYLEQVEDRGQRAFGGAGGGFEVIHPLGYLTPTDIVTSRVMDAGTMVLTIRQTWNHEVWQQMAGLSNAKNIVEIFQTLAARNNYVSCHKVIFPPGGGPAYGKIYHRCVIVDVDDSDVVTIGALSVAKTVTIMYAYTTDWNK